MEARNVELDALKAAVGEDLPSGWVDRLDRLVATYESRLATQSGSITRQAQRILTLEKQVVFRDDTINQMAREIAALKNQVRRLGGEDSVIDG